MGTLRASPGSLSSPVRIELSSFQQDSVGLIESAILSKNNGILKKESMKFHLLNKSLLISSLFDLVLNTNFE